MRALEQAHLTVRSLLSRGLAATTVARLSGLSRASEVWGGATPLDRPAWYVWVEALQGAYRLELEEATALALDRPASGTSTAGAAPDGGWHARLSVRYYPSPREPWFERFSPEEREAIRSARFDATGTPAIDAAHELPAHLFLVGSLEWAVSPEGDAAALALSALDRSRCRAGPGLARDVPAWSLSTPLLSALAGVHAQLQRHLVERVVLAHQPGFEVVDTGEGPACVDAVDVVQAVAVLGFAALERGATSAPLLAALQDREARLVADERFEAGCRHPASLERDRRTPLPVSHAWFGGAAHREEGLVCSC